MFNSLLFWILLLLVVGALVTVSVLFSLLDVFLQFGTSSRKRPVEVPCIGIAASGFAIAALVLAWTMVAKDEHRLLPSVLAITVGVAGSWVALLWASHRRAWVPIVRSVVLLTLCGLWWFLVIMWGSSVIILTGGPTEDPEWEKKSLKHKLKQDKDNREKDKVKQEKQDKDNREKDKKEKGDKGGKGKQEDGQGDDKDKKDNGEKGKDEEPIAPGNSKARRTSWDTRPTTRLTTIQPWRIIPHRPAGEHCRSPLNRTAYPQLRSPRLLHLSLPGFFLIDQPITVRSTGAAAPGGGGEPMVVGWENPLGRAGLVLTPTDRLTAHDVTMLDLWDTTAVVLPAIHTPAGQNNAWSKVSGLVNAFVQAGARHVVLSLWRAPEPVRQEIVMALYEGLSRGASVPEALREARLLVRSRHPEPRDWAGWVCVGEAGGKPEA